MRLVPKDGLEPSCFSAIDFESIVSAIPPLGQSNKMEPCVGLEPTEEFLPIVYKTIAVATEPTRRDIYIYIKLTSRQFI